MNFLREKIRNFLLESYYQETLDFILDKISKHGLNSLNDFENSILKNMSENKVFINSDKDLVFYFLDFHLGSPESIPYNMDKLSKKASGIYFLDKNKNGIFDLEIESEVLGIKKENNILYINYELIKLLDKNFKISENNAKEFLVMWLKSKKNIKVNKSLYFF